MLYIIGTPCCPYPDTPSGRKRFASAAIALVEHLERVHRGCDPRQKKPNASNGVLEVAPFLADVFALAEISSWERANQLQYLHGDAPSFHDAASEIREKLLTSPEQYLISGPGTTPLHERVNQLRNRSFRFSIEFAATFVVGQVDEEALLDCLVDLLWANRHSSEASLSSKALTQLQKLSKKHSKINDGDIHFSLTST